jgi:hypothetical protein
MSGYSSDFWFALCASLTGLGLVLTVLLGRRRSVRSMLHGAAWSLIPIAAYLTGSTLMFWRIGVAIGQFASSFVFDPLRWAGIGVTGLIVVLFLVAGGRSRRKAARQGRAARLASKETTAVVPSGAAGAVTSGANGTGLSGAEGAIPSARAPQQEPPPARRGKGAPAGKAPGGAAPLDNLAEIEEILRKRGILPLAVPRPDQVAPSGLHPVRPPRARRRPLLPVERQL